MPIEKEEAKKQPGKPKLSPQAIEERRQEHLRRVRGPAKVGGK